MSNNTYVYIDYQYDKCKDKDSFVNKFKKDFHCAAFTVETYNYNEGDPYINNFKIVFSDKHLIQMKFKNKNKNNIIERALKNGQDQGTYEINYNVQSEPCYISEVAAMCYPGQLYRFNNEIRVASTLLNPGSSKLLSNNYYIVNTREYKVGGESMGVFGKKPDTTTPNTKYYTYTKPLSYPDGESSTNRVA